MESTSHSHGLSEHEYISKLIEAVAKRPVLYNVELADYKNKNKKGEGFKEVQTEIREAGATETQVQAIYKKWISIKRKFRVEYLRTKADEENGRVPTTTYPYYESLKFLIPYCEFYKMCSQTTKRRANFFEEESDEERGFPEEDEYPSLTPQATLDYFIQQQQKRAKLETQVNELAFAAAAMAAANATTNGAPVNGSAASDDAADEHAAFLANSTSSASSSSSTTPSKAQQQQHQRKTPGSDLMDLSGRASSPGHAADESQNALFGQLVARELDKLPPPTHNLMRAQILFLIAQTSQNFQMGAAPAATSATDRLLSSLNCFMP